jgi:hypothetical protein
MQLSEKTIVLPISNYVAAIREADGYADRLLFSKRNNFTKAYPEYWAHCCKELDGKKPTAADILNLLLPDQNFLSIEIFKLSYGDNLDLETVCLGCGKEIGVTVDLSKLVLRPLPDNATPPNPEWEFKLPKSGKKVKYGYTTLSQEFEDANAVFNPTRDLFKHIRSIDGKPPIYTDLEKIQSSDLKALRKTMLKKATGYDSMVDVTCVHCSKEVQVNILLDPGFLFGGI